MKITIENLSKRFSHDWIFCRLDYHFEAGKPCAIIGSNGSGKSTLLQLLAGMGQPTQGNITYQYKGKNLLIEHWYKQIVIAAPYLELIEEFTLQELVNFHTKFKPLRDSMPTAAFIEAIQLVQARHKPVKYFSSGMKQRLKLGLAFYTDAPVMLLDEPTTNLDAQGTDWYKKTLENNINQRLCVICSNQPHEYELCTQTLDIMQFKNC